MKRFTLFIGILLYVGISQAGAITGGRSRTNSQSRPLDIGRPIVRYSAGWYCWVNKALQNDSLSNTDTNVIMVFHHRGDDEKTKLKLSRLSVSIFEHLAVVKACAPRGIQLGWKNHCSKYGSWLAQMQTLVKQHNIQLLTNMNYLVCHHHKNKGNT